MSLKKKFYRLIDDKNNRKLQPRNWTHLKPGIGLIDASEWWLAVDIVIQQGGSGHWISNFLLFYDHNLQWWISASINNDPAIIQHHDSGSGRCSVLDWAMSPTLQTRHKLALSRHHRSKYHKGRRKVCWIGSSQGAEPESQSVPQNSALVVSTTAWPEGGALLRSETAGISRRCRTRLTGCRAIAAPQRPLYHLFMSCRLWSLPRKFICVRLLMTVGAASSSLFFWVNNYFFMLLYSVFWWSDWTCLYLSYDVLFKRCYCH